MVLKKERKEEGTMSPIWSRVYIYTHSVDYSAIIIIINNNDIVCRIPPAWLGFRHHGTMIYFDRNGNKAPKPTWGDLFYGILNSWKRFKFFDGVVDHGMPHYVKALRRLAKVEK